MAELTRAVTAVLAVSALVGILIAVVFSSVARNDEIPDRRARSADDSPKSRFLKPTSSKPNFVIGLEGNAWTLTNANGTISVPATVPGNMYTALEMASVIGDPYYGFNDDLYRWVHWDNWTYTSSFQATSEFVSQPAARLVCEGLDTIADVYINDILVGSAQNQFARYVYDVTSALQVGANTIRVAFTSAPHFAKDAFDSHPYRIPPDCPPPEYKPECHVNMVRKAACSFSWDWGPSFATQGIHAAIWVESNEIVKVRDVVPYVDRAVVGADWLLNVTVFLDIAGSSFQGDVRVEIPEISYMFEVTDVVITAAEGKIIVPNMVVPDSVEAWWPRGYGGQKLYVLQVTMVDASAGVADTKSVRTAFRTVYTVEEALPSGLTFYFMINEVPIYMKGSNWIPVDSFLDRVTPERLRRLLDSAVYVNMNSIRIWGGGVYEKDEFYDIADELGILIWQDLMFACNMYPVHQPFLDNVRDEIDYQVRRLSRHPCVVAWTANNENEGALVDDWYGTAGPLYERYKQDYVGLYIDTIMDAIYELDITRPFLPSSPTNGRVTEQNGWISEDPRPSSPDYGDIHYYNYDDDCLDHNIYLPTRYSSEYGYQSWPSIHTLAKVGEPGDLYYGSDFAVHRQHHPGAGNGTEGIVRMHFTWPNSGDQIADFPNIIYLTQAMQAMCYRTQTEYYRRAQSDPDIRTMGALYWQHNDIWQAPTWATIDIEGNWKMAHYYAAHFFADPIISAIEDADILQLYTVTDQLTDTNDVNIIIQLWNWASPPGTTTFSWSIPTTVPAAGSTLAYTRPITEMLTEGGCAARAECLLTIHLESSTSGQRISPVNPHYLVSWKDAVGMAKPAIQITDVTEVSPTEFTISMSTNNIAAFVWLEAVNIPGRFSDNGFLWVDSPTMAVTFHAWEDTLLDDLIAALNVKSLADIY